MSPPSAAFTSKRIYAVSSLGKIFRGQLCCSCCGKLKLVPPPGMKSVEESVRSPGGRHETVTLQAETMTPRRRTLSASFVRPRQHAARRAAARSMAAAEE